MSESNCGCSCAYQTPPWWVTMRFTDAGPGAPLAAPPATQPAQPQQPPPSTTSGGGGGDSGLGGILNTVGGALGGVLGGLI